MTRRRGTAIEGSDFSDESTAVALGMGGDRGLQASDRNGRPFRHGRCSFQAEPPPTIAAPAPKAGGQTHLAETVLQAVSLVTCVICISGGTWSIGDGAAQLPGQRHP